MTRPARTWAAGLRFPFLLALALSWLAFTHGARADLIMLGGNILNQKGAALGVGFADADTGDLTLDPALRMGVLTQTPSANLHVAGNLLVTDSVIFSQLGSAPTPPAGYAALYALSGVLYYKDATRTVGVSGGSGASWSQVSGNYCYSPGNVGIGTSSPSANLHVTGVTQSSNQVLIADGTAAAPGLAFANDPDTGLYLGSAGNLCFGVGGAMILSVSGNLVLNGADLRTDRWLHTDWNTFAGVGVAGAGNLTHTTGDEGWYNTAVGYQALFSCNTGFYNTALGARALWSVTSGNANTAIGYQALFSCTTGANNTAIGSNCLYRNLGSFNTACGASAMHENTTGEYNLAFGAYAMWQNSTGGWNTACGAYALSAGASSGTGSHNAALGSQCLRGVAGGSYNSAAGSDALRSCTSGSENAALGYQAGCLLTTGCNNVLLGPLAGYNLSSGCNNVLLGAQAGDSLTTGCNNIVIGRNQDVPTGSTSNWLNIGGVLQGDLSAGTLGIGTASPAACLHVNGNVVCGNLLPAANVTYDLGSSAASWASVYATDLYMVSDRRRKTDIRPLEYGLRELRLLEPVEFRWRADGTRDVGFIAQDVERVVPEAVRTGTDPAGMKSLRCGALVPVLVRSVQEVDARSRAALEECGRELGDLRARGEALRAELRGLRAERRP